MAEAVVVRNTLATYGCTKASTQAFLTDQVGLTGAEAFGMLDKQNLKDAKKMLQAENARQRQANVPVPDTVDCALTTNFALDTISYAVQLLHNRGMEYNANMLQSINTNDAARFYKELRRFEQSTKSTSDATSTTWAKLPANTKQNSPQYSSWRDHLESQLDQLVSADGVTPMGYLLREDENPTPYADLDANDDLATRCKQVAQMDGETFTKDKQTLYTVLKEACSDCGLSWIEKHQTTRDGRAAWTDLSEYYYGEDSRETAIQMITNKIDGLHYHREETRSFESFTGQLRSYFEQLEHIGADAQMRNAQKVNILIKAIKVQDTRLQVAMNQVENDTGANGMANDFEAAVKYLSRALPTKKTSRVRISKISTQKLEEKLEEQSVQIKELTEKVRFKRKDRGGRGKDRQKPDLSKYRWKRPKLSKERRERATKTYPWEEWKAFGKDVQAEIREDRLIIKAEAQYSGGGGGDKKARLKALKGKLSEVSSTLDGLELGVEEESEEDEDPADSIKRRRRN